MPYQSRGFWCCDYCKLSLDSFEDAKQHELEECQQNPIKPQQQQQQNLGQSQFYQQQRPPAQLAGYFPSGAMAPVTTAVKQSGGVYESSNARSAPLMGINETSQMNADDSVACQSVSVFEAGPEDASDADLRAQFPSLAAGHIGIRCSHCSSNPSSTKDGAILFPASIEAMSDGVRILSERHLGSCTMAPASVRDMNQQAVEKRSRNDQERGSSWQDDERSRMAMRDWCHRFCQLQGIVDKGPNGTGLVFMEPPAEMYGSAAPGTGGTTATTMPGRARVMGAAEALVPTPLGARRRERPSMTGDYRAAAAVGGVGYESYSQGGGEGGFYSAPEAMAGHATAGHELSQQQQQGSSPHRGYQQQQQQQIAPLDGGHDNFPFFPEANGCWTCKYCSHVPPPYRQPQSSWGAPNHMPPPPQYMDQHLSMCRAYHQSMPSQPMFQGGPSPAQLPFMAQQFPGGFGGPAQQGGWDGAEPQPYHSQSALENPSTTPTHLSSHSPYPHTPHQMTGATSTASHAMMSQSRTPASAARRSDATDAAVQHAIDFLTAADREASFAPGANAEGLLVLDEDKLLLTDYFFHLMKQLRLCRFSEADRKTRGGKREKILIGFGGLQCIHCSEANNSRKFFWSNVDRLANSFAEIPGHVLKCRHCPQQNKDALFQLKQLHPEQMARLPRGSQKVFFRRMWRRLHDEDPQAPSPGQASPRQAAGGDVKFPALGAKGSGNDTSPSGASGSDESILLLQRSTKEAAKALADSSAMSFPPSPTSRVLLAIPEDKEWLSDTDCFIRRQIEVFCATNDDVNVARSDRKFPVHEGQVGIRCIHCALTKEGLGARGSAVAYPFSVSGIYESVREFQRLHLDSCENLPVEMKAKFIDMKGSTSLSSVLRKYYVLASKALGLKDTREGIRAGAGSVPIGSQAAFAFSDNSSSISEEMRRSTMPQFADAATPLDAKKRKQETPESLGSQKRSHS